ncbi:MAG: nucleotidyl transferase AbiEii/AbiGii toxin family protein, partial [candidate division Zixibacteria bacterium]|nr:nucleotidyl transferase AbiEii/AbiGii toxin family protein [candidate division Zixibacteria bacterium]
MISNKLANMLSIISDNLSQKQIPFCLIGAMALGVYGLPRYTSDIDLLTENSDWTEIASLMERLSFECYQKTDSFAQFDSELGVYGRVDFMFVSTQDGRDVIKRSALIKDEMFGKIHVIQPSDYIILKLMAIANNPDRSMKDESDISTFVDLHKNNMMPKQFDALD